MNQVDKTQVLPPYFETFGQYLFLRRLAAGGMAEIFLARPASLMANGRVQVVKRILPHVANNPMFIQMFQTEIQVIMGFNHPHTVQLHDFGEYNGQPYISMEYIEGKNLKEVISKVQSKKQMIPVPMALSLASQAAAGLSYAHTFVNKVTGEEVHAIHRDISPHNLILSYEGNLKVIDFGIAKAASGMAEATRVGTIKGKIAYLSPEQVNGKPLDARSDIFALGIVLWELLTLRRPFNADTESDVTILNRINQCDQSLLLPSTFNSEVPPEVDEIVMKALRRNPDERFSTAREFQVALRKVMMRYYPNYTYSDIGQLMGVLFQDEIKTERKELQKLNLEAQNILTSNTNSGLVESQGPGVVAGVFKGIRAMVPGAESVDVRLMNIEKMMLQKATRRHYLMFFFYIFSLVMLKMEGDYSIFNILLKSKEAKVQVVAEQQVKEIKARKPASKGAKRKLADRTKTKKSASSHVVSEANRE